MSEKEKNLSKKEIVEISVGLTILLATIARYIIKKSKVETKEPSDKSTETKHQKEILKEIEKIREKGDSIFGYLGPHTSTLDHTAFMKVIKTTFEKWDNISWFATMKFKKGLMGLVGRLTQAYLSSDEKIKIHWVWQAYLTVGMEKEEALQAKENNAKSVKDAAELLKKGKSAVFIYFEGTRKPANEDGTRTIELSRAHPGTFSSALKAAQEGKKKVYIIPMALGSVSDKFIMSFFPVNTTVTYGEPIDILTVKKEFDDLKKEYEIRFTQNAANKHHHPRNPVFERKIDEDGVKQVGPNNEKLYNKEKPSDLSFADYVIWKYFAPLMPKNKQGVYGKNCIAKKEKANQ